MVVTYHIWKSDYQCIPHPVGEKTQYNIERSTGEDSTFWRGCESFNIEEFAGIISRHLIEVKPGAEYDITYEFPEDWGVKNRTKDEVLEYITGDDRNNWQQPRFVSDPRKLSAEEEIELKGLLGFST